MRSASLLAALAVTLLACSSAGDSSSPGSQPGAPPPPSGSRDAGSGDGDPSTPQQDSGSDPQASTDASTPKGNDDAAGPKPPPPAYDAAAPNPAPEAGTSGGDGTPVRQPCTGNFGSGLSSSHARLDGIVVAVLPPGSSHSCNGDSTHVHVQVLMSGSVYDVAVNVDGLETEKDAPLPGAPWSEGWHTQDGLDYVADLGLHASDFTLTGASAVASEVEQRLASANHVAIFCTGYSANGCHLVHRSSGRDGAIVIDPLSATPHWLVFDFSADSF